MMYTRVRYRETVRYCSANVLPPPSFLLSFLFFRHRAHTSDGRTLNTGNKKKLIFCAWDGLAHMQAMFIIELGTRI